MNDPITTAQNIIRSRTTSKVLTCLVVGIMSAYILRSGNPFAIGMAILMLVLLTSCIVTSAYYEHRRSAQTAATQPRQPAKPESHNTFHNRLLIFLLLMGISLWT